MKRFLACCLILLVIVGAGAGCGRENALNNMETVRYIHLQGGYALTVPKDWQKQIEDRVSVGFTGSNPAVALNVIYELGGYDYYSLPGLAEEVVSSLKLKGKIKDLEIVDTSEGKEESGVHRFIARGILPGEREAVIKGIILEPAAGIRYYLLFTSAVKDYPALDHLFDDIAGSFSRIKEGKELYPQLTAREQEMGDKGAGEN